MVCFSPAFLACPTHGCLPRLTCSCELLNVGIGTALLESLQALPSRERMWLESKRLGLCLVCLRQGLCGLPKEVEGMKDHLPAYEETMLSSFREYHKGKCISRTSGWPWCAKGGSGGCLRAELVPLERRREVNLLLV